MGDFNQDGKADLAVLNGGSSNVSILLGNGDGTFQPAVNFATGASPNYLTVGDFNGDGKADLIIGYVGQSSGPSSDLLLGNGDGTFQAARAVSDGISVTMIGDFNGDGRADVVAVTVLPDVGSPFSVQVGDGSGSFVQSFASAIGDLMSLTIGDFNGDGKTDLAAVIYGYYDPYGYSLPPDVAVLLGNGDGTFMSPVTTLEATPDTTLGGFVVAGDFNGDGKLDLAFNGSGTLYVASGNGDGTFGAVRTYTDGSVAFQPLALATGDFNGDGRTDIAVIQYGKLTIMLGKGGGPVSLTPSSGNKTSQAFTVKVSDTDGATAFNYAYFVMSASSSPSGANGCFIEYNRAANTLRLASDAASAWLGPVAPGVGSPINNSQCTLNPGASSVAVSGNDITINLALSFNATFVGARTTWVGTVDMQGAGSGLQQLGTWGIAGVPSAISITPNSGSGASSGSQTFAVTGSDNNGWGAITSVSFLINGPFLFGGGCYVQYNRAANTLSLANDAATNSAGSVTPGTGSSISNSQCTLNPAASSVSTNGNNLTINVALSFSAAFGGSKRMWLNVGDAAAFSGFQNLGTWTVQVPAGVPSAISISPNTGSGTTQTFTLTVSDTNGAAFLSSVYFLVNSALSGTNACFIQYNPTIDTLSLAIYQGYWFATTPGTGSSISNSQCTLNPAGSSVTTSGNNMTINVALSFNSLFFGGKNLWLAANDFSGAGSGFQNVGAWTVPGSAGVPSAVSISPNSGNGASQTFSLVVSDTNGVGAIGYVYFLINSTLSGNNGCFIQYNPAEGVLQVANDAATGWLAPGWPNGQCTLGVSRPTSSGNTLTISVSLSFAEAFAGPKNMWLAVSDITGQSSGFQSLGTWTVASLAPSAVSISPSAGIGTTQTFLLEAASGGWVALTDEYFLVNSTLNGSNGCFVRYHLVDHTMWLANDAASAWIGPVTPTIRVADRQ
jgi:hypothetical protein